MNLEYLNQLNLRLSSLVIFRGILSDEALGFLPPLLSCGGGKERDRASRYAEFVSRLFKENENLSEYILDRVLTDENFYVLKRAAGEPVSETLEECLQSELKTLEELSRLDPVKLREELGIKTWLPDWRLSAIDFARVYRERLERIRQIGFGVFAKHLMFSECGGRVLPVRTPDPVRLTELKGYGREKEALVGNTLALLAGKPAANALLYGDAGTGKSSTVKAVVNEYGREGLRLIEVRKDALSDIPALIGSLGKNPLKFVIFIDDLSFSGVNEQIGALKAVLEGSASFKTPNAVIYATSNRRHIVNERFSDREGDEIHQNETIEEQISLSDRFGLKVYFERPDMKKYLEIVYQLSSQYGIRMRKEKIALRAEAYATERGGRSPRIARQFVEYLKCGGE